MIAHNFFIWIIKGLKYNNYKSFQLSLRNTIRLIQISRSNPEAEDQHMYHGRTCMSWVKKVVLYHTKQKPSTSSSYSMALTACSLLYKSTVYCRSEPRHLQISIITITHHHGITIQQENALNGFNTRVSQLSF